MYRKIRKLPINGIIVCIITLLVFSYCIIMIREFKTIDEDYTDKTLEYEIESSLVNKDNFIYGVINSQELENNDNNDTELVLIKDFSELNYIVAKEDGYESEVSEPLVEARIWKEQVSRSSISRKDKSIARIIDAAHKNLGRSYVYGDIGVKGFDCSGLTYSIYLNNLGIKLPRSSSSLISAGKKVNKSDLAPGDIILFNTSGKGISHAGLYIGDGKMIHASSGKKKVVIEDINSKYYSARYVTARRIIN